MGTYDRPRCIFDRCVKDSLVEKAVVCALKAGYIMFLGVIGKVDSLHRAEPLFHRKVQGDAGFPYPIRHLCQIRLRLSEANKDSRTGKSHVSFFRPLLREKGVATLIEAVGTDAGRCDVADYREPGPKNPMLREQAKSIPCDRVPWLLRPGRRGNLRCSERRRSSCRRFGMRICPMCF